MSLQRHRIRRQIIEVTVDQASQAWPLQAELGRIFSQHLEGILDRCLSELGRPNHIHRIARLEVDLGRIKLDNLERHLIDKFGPCLRAALTAALREEAKDNAASGENPEESARLELLSYFTQTGNLPWWADPAKPGMVDKTLGYLLTHAPRPLVLQLAAVVPARGRLMRIVLHAQDGRLSSLFTVLLSFFQPSLAAQLPDQPAMLRALVQSHPALPSLTPTAWRTALWMGMLRTASGNAEAPPDRELDRPTAFFQAALAQVALESAGPYTALVAALHDFCESPSQPAWPAPIPSIIKRLYRDLPRKPITPPLNVTAAPTETNPLPQAGEEAETKFRQVRAKLAEIARRRQASPSPNLSHEVGEGSNGDGVRVDFSPSPGLSHEVGEGSDGDGARLDFSPSPGLSHEVGEGSDGDGVRVDKRRARRARGIGGRQINDKRKKGPAARKSQVTPPNRTSAQAENSQLKPPILASSQTENSQLKLPILISSQTENSQLKLPILISSQTENSQLNPPILTSSQTENSQLKLPILTSSQTENSQLKLPIFPSSQAKAPHSPPPILTSPLAERSRRQPRVRGPHSAHKSNPSPPSPLPSPSPTPPAHAPRNLAQPPALRLDYSQSDEIYVENAGLVLLWPFLVHLYGRLELLGEKLFKDRSALHRAVGLLQHLISAEPFPQEYQLSLAKILCGMDLNEVLIFGPPVTELEAQECTNLLTAAIVNAPIFGEISIPVFRDPFLIRKGVLSTRDDVFLLRVERAPYDIVLDRLPWTLNWVKLPWTDTPLRVEW